ncbi:MAG TPA: DUF1573 domain-containing protein [Flavisolibacter sp.]|nr:DUF1573 domain-containing protein [Flavisolibacter sp.]
MKKILLLAAVFATGFTAMAQQKADEVMKVNVETYDFGKIKQGVPVTTYFTITNTTDKPITIENAWAGCGCTTPEYSKEPIAPGGTSKLKVGYNAAAMGHFTKDVNVKIAGIAQQKVVKITGEVVDATAFDALSKTGTKKLDEVKKVKVEDKNGKTETKVKKG